MDTTKAGDGTRLTTPLFLRAKVAWTPDDRRELAEGVEASARVVLRDTEQRARVPYGAGGQTHDGRWPKDGCTSKYTSTGRKCTAALPGGRERHGRGHRLHLLAAKTICELPAKDDRSEGPTSVHHDIRTKAVGGTVQRHGVHYVTAFDVTGRDCHIPSLGIAAAIIAAGHIHLILSYSTDDFYLEIPIAVVQSNSVHPIKYLRFLGWCIIGILGTVKSDREGVDIVDTALLQDRGTYFYELFRIQYSSMTSRAATLRYAVDPDVIKARSHVSTSDSSIRARGDAFKDSLLQRGASCIFTDVPPLLCEGTHIIPFHKWFDLIVKNRPASADDDVSDLTTVNDRRNGMLLGLEVHVLAESRQVVVIHVCCLFVEIFGTLISRYIRRRMLCLMSTTSHPATLRIDDNIKYPDRERYTLHWLDGASPKLLTRVPNNSDATFRKYTHIPKPSPMLLHYNYGAAAVKWWGHGKSHLEISNRPTMPRPSVPVPAATGPTRTKRTAAQLDTSIQKRATGNTGASGSGPRESEAARDEEAMDPDEIVMFFWSQNPAAVERRKREAEDRIHEEEERASRMEQWRESVMAV
ncbi:hypothetical protein B0H13DRAFT_1868754 [Mycena leptocephala]|nr:hypothetical protein B0H13DRAFT_1868754 [Mycena leptocephala]